jgi:hypothetical protein
VVRNFAGAQGLGTLRPPFSSAAPPANAARTARSSTTKFMP